MRKLHFGVACSILLCGGFLAKAQSADAPKPASQATVAAVEREIRDFLDSYANDLRQNRREAIADRSDPSGVYKLGFGRKVLDTFDTVKRSYLTEWEPPKSFAWKDISIEVLSTDAAVVLARFDWQMDSGQTITFSYTGLYKRISGKWRIRVEDESMMPPPQK